MTDEKFFAWLDGELSGPEAADVARRVANDPALAARASKHRELARTLRSAFDPLLTAPLPDALVERVRAAPPAAGVADFQAARDRRLRGMDTARRKLPQWAALAASLAAAFYVGTLVSSPAGSPMVVRDGQMYAASTVSGALETSLASAPTDSEVRIGLTFRDRAGDVCRTFETDGYSGLACRAEDGWIMRGLFGAEQGRKGEFRMASGLNPELARLVDTEIDGEAFNAPQERTARDAGWR